MFLFVINKRQHDIFEYILSSVSISEARLHFNEQHLADRFHVSLRSIKTDRHDILINNPELTALKFLHSGRKSSSSLENAQFESLITDTHEYVLLDKDTQRLCIILNQLAYHHPSFFRYSDFMNEAQNISAFPIASSAQQYLLTEYVKRSYFQKSTSSRQGVYSYRLPHLYAYPAPSVLNFYLKHKMSQESFAPDLEPMGSYMNIYSHHLLKLRPNNINPFFFYTKTRMNGFFKSFFHIISNLDVHTYSIRLAFSNSSPIEHFHLDRLLYSVDKQMLYLTGYAETSNNTYVPKIIRADQLLLEQLSQSREKNKITSKKIFSDPKAYQEMLSVSFESPQNVRVRILPIGFFPDGTLNYGNLLEKIMQLVRRRPDTAHLVPSPDGRFYIYTDTIRGEGDFLRFVRSTSNHLVIEEPASIRNKMAQSAKDVIAMYHPEISPDPAKWYYDAIQREKKLTGGNLNEPSE